MVTTMISLPLISALASRPDFDFASPPAFAASSRSMATMMPLVVVDLFDRVRQLGVEHGAIGHDDDRVEELLVIDL